MLARWLMMFLLAASFSLISQQAHAAADDPRVPTADQVDQTGCAEVKNAFASGQAMIASVMSSGGSVCPCAPKPGVWIERIVYCFANAPGGLIYNSVGRIITNSSFVTFYRGIIGATIFFALLIFGVKMTLGTVHSLSRESLTLALKIGAVLLFFSQYIELFKAALTIIQDLSEIISVAAAGFGDICNSSGAANIWARWDCLFQKLLGIVNNGLFLGILGVLTHFLFTFGMASAVFFGGIYIVITVLLMAMRAVYTYLVAIMAVAFLFLLAPLFVPTIFFSTTYQKFATWFKIILAYMIQPALLMLFLVMILTALEFAIFVGPTSLFASISNTNPSKSMEFSQVMYENQSGGGILGKIASAVSGQKNDISKHFKDQVVGGTINSNSELNQQSQASSTDTGATGVVPSNPNALTDAGSFDAGALLPGIDMPAMISSLKSRADAFSTGLTENEWLQNIVMQMVASGILIFILYNMLSTVPQITHDLVSQRLGKLGEITRAQMPGEAEMRKSVRTQKDAIEQTRQSGDGGGALNNAYKDLMQGRDSW